MIYRIAAGLFFLLTGLMGVGVSFDYIALITAICALVVGVVILVGIKW